MKTPRNPHEPPTNRINRTSEPTIPCSTGATNFFGGFLNHLSQDFPPWPRPPFNLEVQICQMFWGCGWIYNHTYPLVSSNTAGKSPNWMEVSRKISYFYGPFSSIFQHAMFDDTGEYRMFPTSWEFCHHDSTPFLTSTALSSPVELCQAQLDIASTPLKTISFLPPLNWGRHQQKNTWDHLWNIFS